MVAADPGDGPVGGRAFAPAVVLDASGPFAGASPTLGAGSTIGA